MAVSKVEQVEDNVKAIEINKKFTPEIDEKIEKVLEIDRRLELISRKVKESHQEDKRYGI